MKTWGARVGVGGAPGDTGRHQGRPCDAGNIGDLVLSRSADGEELSAEIRLAAE